MSILDRLFSIRTSAEHRDAGADIAKEISAAERQAADLRGRIASAPFEAAGVDIEAMRRDIADAEDRVRTLQEVARENERRERAAADSERIAALEAQAADAEALKASLVADYADFHDAATKLAEAAKTIRKKLAIIKQTNRATSEAGRPDLKVGSVVHDLAALTGRQVVEPTDWPLQGYYPDGDPKGAFLARINELAPAKPAGGFLSRLAAE